MMAVRTAVAQWLGAQVVVDEQAAGAEAPHFRAPVHQCVPMRLPLPRGDPGQGQPPGRVFWISPWAGILRRCILDSGCRKRPLMVVVVLHPPVSARTVALPLPLRRPLCLESCRRITYVDLGIRLDRWERARKSP